MSLKAADAKKLIRRLLKEGRFVSPGARTHARKEMDKDGLTDLDVVNVLRAGKVCEAEKGTSSWRYRVETPRMVFVVVLEPEPDFVPSDEDDVSEMEIIIVTGWRIKP